MTRCGVVRGLAVFRKRCSDLLRDVSGGSAAVTATVSGALIRTARTGVRSGGIGAVAGNGGAGVAGRSAVLVDVMAEVTIADGDVDARFVRINDELHSNA